MTNKITRRRGKRTVTTAAMSSILGSMKKTARTARLKTELMLVDREIRIRQEAFGVQLFDYLEPLAQNPNFFSADDRLTQVLRPPLLEAQREIAVVYNKKTQLKERMKQAEAKRAAAFPKKAENWQEKLTNVAKSTSLAGGEAKLKAEDMVLDNTLKSHKQVFGTKLYPVLEDLEDRESWLPTDREVRTIYDNCRRDIENSRKKAKAKYDELETLGVSRKEIQQERDALNSQEQQQDGGLYGAPSSTNMTPVHAPPAPPVPTMPRQEPQHDPFAMTPTSALPVAQPVNNPGFPSAETPVLAYATTTPVPPPPPPPPPQHELQHQQPTLDFGNAGVGPIGGTPMGGAGASMGGMSFGSNPGNSGTGMMGGSIGAMGGSAFGGEDDNGFMMGGSAGMGTLGHNSNFGGQQPQGADPWAGNDPFASFASAPAPGGGPQPPQQHQQQQQQHKDSNLFLY